MGSQHRTTLGWLVVLSITVVPVAAHPASGIVVDDSGAVWFMDTGYGLWDDRADWWPRLRKLVPDGTVTVLAKFDERADAQPTETRELGTAAAAFAGTAAGQQRKVVGVSVCWCPPGRYDMGSPPDEPERRPGEDQVTITLTGFWIGKYEVTQVPSR